MTDTDARRDHLVQKAADHLLEEGFACFTLNAVARTAGTSDRMLVHYFGDKATLMQATLACVAARLAHELDALGLPPSSPDALVSALAEVLASPQMEPYGRVWIGLAARVAEGEPYARAAAEIIDGFLGWARAHLEDASEEAAAYTLTLVDGLMLMATVGRADVAGLAARFVRLGSAGPSAGASTGA